MTPVKEFRVDKLNTKIFDNREEMGSAAAENVFQRINELIKEKDELRIVFAAAPSQNEFLAELITKKIDWSKIIAFHMDEYIGLPEGAKETFGNCLKDHIFSKVKFKEVNYLNSTNTDHEAECERYSELITAAPIDIVCMGIGENGHIAFNDPPVADFNDPQTVKVVELDEPCRHQQVNDGCFLSFDDVPTHAFTLTVPALMSGGHLCVVVPGPAKAEAIEKTLKDAITTECPATILRKHDDAVLYVNKESASLLKLF